MRVRFSRRIAGWLALLTALLAAVWLLLGSGGSASAVEPQVASSAPAPDLTQLAQPVVATVGALGSVLDPLTQNVAPSVQVGQLTSDLATATTTTTPVAPTPPSPTAVVVHPATQLLTAVVAHVLPSHSPLDAVTTTLSQTAATISTTLTSTLDVSLAQTTSALSSALPAGQLKDTLASLAGSVTQLTSSAGSTVDHALAPLRSQLAGSATATTVAPASGTRADAQAHSLPPAATTLPGGADHAFTVAALPLLLEMTHAGWAPATIATPTETSHIATSRGAPGPATHGPSTATIGPDLGHLLAPTDVPPSSPAAQHTPPSPAPAGPDGAGHAHFALGIGALPTLLPVREPTSSTATRLPLSPTFPPGESPD